ncbi:hypothetical protein Xoosp13_393 [Xanthomonas phage Xoo-sp13]|nr:hypothetical protein Xoosp13_393 [Xanthomonas phage Xoo-sp13]
MDGYNVCELKKCTRCNGVGIEPDITNWTYNSGEPDPEACIECLGNGVLHPTPEYNDNGKLIGYNYP